MALVKVPSNVNSITLSKTGVVTPTDGIIEVFDSEAAQLTSPIYWGPGTTPLQSSNSSTGAVDVFIPPSIVSINLGGVVYTPTNGVIAAVPATQFNQLRTQRSLGMAPFSMVHGTMNRAIVAQKMGVPQITINSAAAGVNTEFAAIQKFVMTDDCVDFEAEWQNNHFSGGALVAGQSNITVKAAIRASLNGQSFLGQDKLQWKSTAVIPPEESRVITWPGTNFKEGTEVFVMYKVTAAVAPATAVPGGYSNDGLNEQGTALADRTLDNSTPPGKIANQLPFPPSQVRARVTNRHPRKRRWALLMDSIGSGQGDTNGLVINGITLLGFVQRALKLSVPWCSIGYPGLSFGAMGSEAANIKRMRYHMLREGGVTSILSTLGTNDVFAASNQAIIDRQELVFAEFESEGFEIVPVTVPPRTNAGNTAEASGNVAARRIALNNHNVANRKAIDTRLVTQSPTDPNLWNTAYGTPTSDGVHPLEVMHVAWATELERQFKLRYALSY